MYAIVATGGKQLKVAAGDVVTVEKLDGAVGDKVAFNVIFLADEDTIVVDPTELATAEVTGEILEQFKGEKAIIFKFKKRKGYKRLKGHRQLLTKVRITDVSGKAAPKKAAAPRKKKTEEPAEVVAETAEAVAQD
jgi:large subunit ribosomal protein L21